LLEDIWLHYARHDPKNVVNIHCKSVKYSKLDNHGDCPFDIIFKGAENYEEVLMRISGIEDANEKA
jgi:hypothetical protein